MKYPLLLSVVFLCACGGAKKPDPVPHAPAGSDVRPIIPNAANLFLSCDVDAPRPEPCSAIKYEMNVAGDKVDSCYRRSNGYLKFELRSTASPDEHVLLEIDNYSGPGAYPLDNKDTRHIRISDTTPVATCANGMPTGPQRPEGKVVMSPGIDASCNSSGCTLTIEATDPATPDRLKMTVSCPDLCESGTYLVCTPRGGGPVNFSVTADCPM